MKASIVASVLLGVAFLTGCGGEEASEPSFPRAASTPKPTPEPLAVHVPGGPSIVRPNGKDDPLRPGGEVTFPVEIVRVEPDCASLAGAVRPIMVEVIVTREGAAEGARVLSVAPADAKAAILGSVRTWRFRPSTFNGRPVPVIHTVTFRRCS